MSIPGCYAGSILRVDLSSRKTTRYDTSSYVQSVGGRGLAAKIYWDEVGPDVHPFAPENKLIFANGPLTGIAGFGSARSQVCAKSPAADRQGFCYANMGGTWGVALKSAGYDALVVSGQSEAPVYLLIDDDGASIRSAADLRGVGAIQTRARLKAELGDGTHVVAIGAAGEHLVPFATITGEKGAAGGAGFGAVMGAKGLKAIAVRQGSRRHAVADPQRLKELVRYLRHLLGAGGKVGLHVPKGDGVRADHCWGCPGPCIRTVYRAHDGREDKFTCHPYYMYMGRSQKYYKTDSWEVAFHAANLCNEYGLDTKQIEIINSWLARCIRAGIATDENTDLALSTMGSVEYIESLLHKISYREGFGGALARGAAQAAATLGEGAVAQIGDLVHKHENDTYGARLYLTNALIYAMEPRQAMGQLHEISFTVDAWLAWTQQKADTYLSGDALRAMAKRFWGSEAAADLTSYQGKALAVKHIQDRSLAKECLGLCDWMWPVMFSENTPDHVGDPTLESQIFSAVTGWDVDEAALSLVGERAFVLQRSIMAREGHRGRQDDSLPDFCFDMPLQFHIYPNQDMLVPGPDGKPVSRKGSVVDRKAFEGMKDEYYRMRGWDVATGLPSPLAPESFDLLPLAQ